MHSTIPTIAAVTTAAREENLMSKPTRISRLSVVLLVLSLAGCTSAPTDCRPDIEAARTAGQTGQWLESAIATAGPDCRSAATDAWLESAGALDCSPRFAFAAARLGREIGADCTAASHVGAARLGAMIGELERERESIDAQLADESLVATMQRDLRQRHITIDRDLPQLEALARFDELLPPAVVPDRAN